MNTIWVSKASIWKTPFIGAYSKVFGASAIVNKNAPRGFVRKIKDFLKVDSIAFTNIAGVHAVSSMVATNTDFIIVPDLVEEEELNELRKLGKEVLIMDSKLKAWGNLMILSDRGVVFSHTVPARDARKIIDSLGLDYGFSSLASFSSIGALAVPGEELCFVSKALNEAETRLLGDVLKLKVYAVSVNDGLVFIRLGMLLSSHGVLVGNSTTGAEIINISLAVP
ncbi:MAG: hypothetical protein ACUVQ0_03820 [Thermoproteota archaeon]